MIICASLLIASGCGGGAATPSHAADEKALRDLVDGYAIRMDTVKTEISAGGDLGYAVGTYEQTAPDPSGALIHSVGKWMSVFRKQPDGSWGAIADTFNVDPPK